MGAKGSGDGRMKAKGMVGKEASFSQGEGGKGDSATGAHGEGDAGAGSTAAVVVDPEVVFQLTNDDVLLGRGTRVHVHEGNKRFRVIVEKYARSYALADKNRSLRRDIAYKVIATIHKNGGKFLRGDVGSGTKCWYAASEHAVFTKAKQALRDAGASRASAWQESERRSKALVAAASKTSVSRTMVRNATTEAATARQRARRMELNQALELLLRQGANLTVTDQLLSRRVQLERQQVRLAANAAGIINPPEIVGSSNIAPLVLQHGTALASDHLLQNFVAPDQTARALLDLELQTHLEEQQLLALLGSTSGTARDHLIPMDALSAATNVSRLEGGYEEPIAVQRHHRFRNNMGRLGV